VNRYEAAKDARIAELETQNKLLESNIYTDGKIADVYERLNTKFDAKISCLEAQIGQQAVYNATNNATIGCLSNQVAQLLALTKTVIPAENICPAPMPQYNSWTAPTATT
jgi:enhancing lycopene biosynthesis protein 2